MPSKEFRNLPKATLDVIAPFLSEKPVPLGKIANRLGIRVKVSPMDRGISGQISKAEDGIYEIRINKFETRSRQRYTLSHEIAHFLLHKHLIDENNGIQDNILLRSGLPQKVEYEANRLAADLVMPEDSVTKDADRLSVNGAVTDQVIEKLAAEWGVSKSAMEIKLGNYIYE